MKEKPPYYKEHSQTPLLQRFIHASKGIRNAWEKESNFRIEVLIALFVLGAMLILPLSSVERAILILVITFVLVLEVINSVFERVLDIVHPDFSEDVKKIKDTMAGVVFLASVSSVVVGLFIMTKALLQFDVYLQIFLDNVRTPGWIKLAEFVTRFGDWQVISLLGIILSAFLLYKKRYYFITLFLGSVLMGEGILLLLKFAFSRERPPETHLLGILGYSFPSGHVFVATVFYLIAGFILTRNFRYKNFFWGVPMLIIILVALSRVILSVHWFSDIVGGFIFGIFWLLLWYGINSMFWKNFKNQAQSGIKNR